MTVSLRKSYITTTTATTTRISDLSRKERIRYQARDYYVTLSWYRNRCNEDKKAENNNSEETKRLKETKMSKEKEKSIFISLTNNEYEGSIIFLGSQNLIKLTPRAESVHNLTYDVWKMNSCSNPCFCSVDGRCFRHILCHCPFVVLF